VQLTNVKIPRGLGALTDGNPPPRGHGVYARSQDVAWLSRFDFVVLNGIRANVGTDTSASAVRQDSVAAARALVAMGKPVWFYAFPSWWMPEGDDAARVRVMESLIDATGAQGAVADPENGWPGAGSARVQALSDAIRASVDRGYKWGITSFAELYPRAAPLASSGAWFAPQIYRKNSDNVRLYAEWQNLFGASRTIPSVALWYVHLTGEPPDFPTMADYTSYLAALPAATGSIGWTTDQTSYAFVDAYLAWQPQSGLSKLFSPPSSTFLWWGLGLAAVGALAWWGTRKLRRKRRRR